MASKKEPKQRKYILYVDFKADGHIVRKCKLDRVCTLSEAKAEYSNWKFVREQWNGSDIVGVTLATEDSIVYEKSYLEYDKESIILEEQK